jgi:hypothetical protein
VCQRDVGTDRKITILHPVPRIPATRKCCELREPSVSFSGWAEEFRANENSSSSRGRSYQSLHNRSADPQ